MSLKKDGAYKKFVKIRIRKDDNSVDNDLSSDDEKWLDAFDDEVKKAQVVDLSNLSKLPRYELIRYVRLLTNVKEQNKIIAQFNIADEEFKTKPRERSPEVPLGADNIDPELKEYILKYVDLNSSSSSETTCNTCNSCSCSCTASQSSEDKAKEKDNAKAENAAKLAQPEVISPMRFLLMKPRTPSTTETTRLSTDKRCSSTSSLSPSTTVTSEKDKSVKDNKSSVNLLSDDRAEQLKSVIQPLTDVCKNMIIDVFAKANIDLPPSIANMAPGKENEHPERRTRSRSRSTQLGSSTSLTREVRFQSSPDSGERSRKGLSKKTSKHSSDMSLTPVVSRSPQPGRILRSSSRSTGTTSSSVTSSSSEDGKSSKKSRSKSSGKQITSEILGSPSMSLTPKQSQSDSSLFVRKSSKICIITSSDSENQVPSGALRSTLSDNDKSSNKASIKSSTSSTTTTLLSAQGSSNSITSLSNSKIVSSTPLETPFLSPSSARDGETGHLVMTQTSSNDVHQTGHRRSGSTSLRKSKSETFEEYSPISSRLRSQKLKEQSITLSSSQGSTSRFNVSDSDKNSNKASIKRSTSSATTTLLSASEKGSCNSFSSLSNSKMVTSTPFETPYLSPSSEIDDETGHLVMTQTSSNDMHQNGHRRSRSTSLRKSNSRTFVEYSPISSRLRSQKRKEQSTSSSSSISSENSSSAKTCPKNQFGAKFSRIERSPPIEEVFIPVGSTRDLNTSTETITPEFDDREYTIQEDNLEDQNKQRSVSVIKEYRTSLGNQFTITTEYNSSEGTVTGVQVTVKLEENIRDEELLTRSEQGIEIKDERTEQELHAENPLSIKIEEIVEHESVSDSQIIVKSEDQQREENSQTEDSLNRSHISIKTEEDITENDQDSQVENQILEQDIRRQDLLDLNRSEITVKTDDDSTDYESLPISLLTIKSEDTLTEHGSEEQTSFKSENVDTEEEWQAESQATDTEQESQEESQATEDTGHYFQEQSQMTEDTDQDFQERSQGTVETKDNISEEESNIVVKSPPVRPAPHFRNPDYGGFPDAESLQSAVDEFIRLVRSEMEKEDKLLEEQRRKKLVPFERYLQTGSTDSFTTLVPPHEIEQLRENVQEEETDNWRLSLTSLLDLDDEQLLSRCLPSDDEQVIFNILSSECEDQISVKSIASTSEETTCELFVVHNRLVERPSDDEDKDSTCSGSVKSYNLCQSDPGMMLRSGKTKPTRNEFTYMADNLASLFEMMSLNDREVEEEVEEQQTLEETISSEETMQPPEPVYLSLRGRQVRLRTDNIASIVYQVHRLEVQRNERRQGLKKRMKPKRKEDKLLKEKAQMINIRATRSSTLYSYGKDCTHLAPKKETQKRQKSVQCTMECGKKKAGTCTSTGEPVCSYKCYKNNITRVKKKIKEKLETDDHIHVILIEHEVRELPDEQPSTSSQGNVSQGPPEVERPEEKDEEETEEGPEDDGMVKEDNYEEGTEDDETVEEVSSEDNYEEENEEESEDDDF